nr:hypothetical protein [Tanacetum cinerariifolium]
MLQKGWGYEGGRPSKRREKDNMHQGVNLPPLIAAYLGRGENGQPLQSSLTSIQGGHQPSVNTNPTFRGTAAYHPYKGYALEAPTSSNILTSNGFMCPSVATSTSYPIYTQHMHPLPNAPTYPKHVPPVLFADSTSCVTLFIRWIEDYPLLDGLKMLSHVGSYDGK